MEKSPDIKKYVAGILIALACLTAFSLWGIRAMVEKPNLYPRPHYNGWDVVSLAQRNAGLNVAPGELQIDNSLVIRLSAFLLNALGDSYKSMAAAQLPYLLLLILSVALATWRFGGAFGAVTAAWTAVFAPVVIGAALQLNDVLTIAASAAAVMALISWADFPGKKALALFMVAPVCLGIVSCVNYSHKLVFLLFIAQGIGAFLLIRWICSISNERSFSRGLKNGPIWEAGGSVLALIIGFVMTLPLHFHYLVGEANHPNFEQYSVFHNASVIWACPRAWVSLHVGPVIAIGTILSVILLVVRKRATEMLPFLCWLILPMITLTVLNKRHDFYMAAAIPATFVIVGLGATALGSKKARWAALSILVLLMAGNWFVVAKAPANMKQVESLTEIFEGTPFPYLISLDDQSYRDKADLGNWIAQNCSDQNGRTVFVDSLQYLGLEPFYAWHADSSLKIFTLRSFESPPEEPHCLVVRSVPGQSEDFHAALSFFRKNGSHLYWYNDKVNHLVDAIEARSDDYRAVGTNQDWTIFIPR